MQTDVAIQKQIYQMKTHLIISAHPSENSFSNYLAQQLTENFQTRGWKTEWRNLYDGSFDPVLSGRDLQTLKAGNTPEAIRKEQVKMAEAELITVIYLLWWASFPAVLKGYIDRVLTNGFAFNYGKGGAVGLLTDKRVILNTTMGNTVEEYAEKGLIEAFRTIQGQEVFGFCGMQIIGHHFYPQITLADEKQREHYLQKALNSYPELFAQIGN